MSVCSDRPSLFLTPHLVGGEWRCLGCCMLGPWGSWFKWCEMPCHALGQIHKGPSERLLCRRHVVTAADFAFQNLKTFFCCFLCEPTSDCNIYCRVVCLLYFAAFHYSYAKCRAPMESCVANTVGPSGSELNLPLAPCCLVLACAVLPVPRLVSPSLLSPVFAS